MADPCLDQLISVVVTHSGVLCLESPSAGVDVPGMGQSAVGQPGHRGGLCLVFSTLADGSGLSNRSSVSFPSEL